MRDKELRRALHNGGVTTGGDYPSTTYGFDVALRHAIESDRKLVLLAAALGYAWKDGGGHWEKSRQLESPKKK